MFGMVLKGLKNNVIVNCLSTLHKNCKMQSLDINNNYIPTVWNKN